MSFYSADESRFTAWRQAIEPARTDLAWDEHDKDIRDILLVYQLHLQGNAGFIPPRRQLIKALIWVETGGPHAVGGVPWRTRPMQIGNPGDAGIDDVLHSPVARLVTPSGIRANLTVNSIRSHSKTNIEAGVCFLLMKLARTGHRPLPAALPSTPANPVSSRQSVPVHHNTAGTIRRTPLTILSWSPFTPVTLYQAYNLGDALYARKLSYCLDLMAQLPANRS